MDLDAVIARLKGQITGMREIGGAADLDAAIKGNVAVPALYVVRLSVQAERSKSTGPVRQRLTTLFGVLQVTENLRDIRGGAAAAQVEKVSDAVMAALIGWVPDAGTGEPVEFVGGDLVAGQANGRIWWSDEFEFISYRSA